MKNMGDFGKSYTGIDARLFSKNSVGDFPHASNFLFNHALGKKFKISNLQEDIPALLRREKNTKFSIFSQAYAGHQFGHFSILGDGRAHILTELQYENTLYDIQLKGSGTTRYSRGGDGRATLSAMLREYIISESMNALGIPTSRSLAVFSTGEVIHRGEREIGAVLARIAQSHIRIGTFEYIATLQDTAILKKFTKYVIERHYPQCTSSEDTYWNFIKAVGEKQIECIIGWLRVGFIHGVMNTDNTFISGETLDYGPCAFLNGYEPNKVYSSIDTAGRYSYINQMHIILWNLARFIETLLPLLGKDQEKAINKAQEILTNFEGKIKKEYYHMMHKKIGILEENPESQKVLDDFIDIMTKNQSDFTHTFISLEKKCEDESYHDEVLTPFTGWIPKWKEHISDRMASLHIMKKNNPKIIPRNHLVEKALFEAKNGDMTFFNNFLSLLQHPYEPPSDVFFMSSDPNDTGYKTFCGT